MIAALVLAPAGSAHGLSRTCPRPAGDVVVCLAPGEEVASYTAVPPALAEGLRREVAAYGDLYRFTLPGGVTTSVQCVTPAVDGFEPDACDIAGGTFVRREVVLLRQGAGEPVLSTGPAVTTVRVCRAELTVTVYGAGVTGVATHSIC